MKVRNLSPYQVGTMEYINRYVVKIDDVGTFSQITIRSLLLGDGLITKDASGVLHWTHRGEAAMAPYLHRKAAMRSDSRIRETEGQMTDSVRRLIAHARTIQMSRRA